MGVAYENRYNDVYSISDTDKHTILITGTFGYRRVILIDGYDNRYTMVDPSGGPSISRGVDMGYYDEKWAGRIVDYLSGVKGGYIIHLFDTKKRLIKDYINKL